MSARLILVTLIVGVLGGVAGAVSARVPEGDEIYWVEDLALQMDVDADEAYVEAVRVADPGDQREAAALQDLYSLKESAALFREQVQISLDSPRHTTVAFERLNEDFIEARAGFRRLIAYSRYRELFETIEDTMGNLRFYYVSAGEYEHYADHEVYPYYPGYHLFVHIYAPAVPVYYRYAYYWHLHPTYARRFPYRVNYRFGYARYDTHYAVKVEVAWHKSADFHARVIKQKAAPVKKVTPVKRVKPVKPVRVIKSKRP